MGRVLAVAILGLFIGFSIVEPFYVRHHRPLIAAELAEAERQGPLFIEEIGAPPGSTLSKPLEKYVSTPNFKSKWHGINNSMDLVASWLAPGTPAQVNQWYRHRLPAQGWHAVGPYNEIGSKWEREKWMLSVEHNEWWDAHARARVRLYWNYGRTNVDRAEGG